MEGNQIAKELGEREEYAKAHEDWLTNRIDAALNRAYDRGWALGYEAAQALTTALSECREREQKLDDVRSAAEEMVSPMPTFDTMAVARKRHRKLAKALASLAAEPPSESSERSGT